MTNDDYAMVDQKIIYCASVSGVSEKAILATICDGVGGRKCGDVAARISSEVFASLSTDDLTVADIEKAVQNANLSVIAGQEADELHSKMATTLAGVYLTGRDVITFNVGDSKIFRLRNSYLTQLSVDHTFAQESIGLGLVRSRDEIDEKDLHKITRWVGDKRRCIPAIHYGENRVLDKDVFIICSDGLSDVVSAEEIEDVLPACGELSLSCEKLYDLAMKKGSADNISVVILEAITDDEN
ncbi:MAG: serine/threonine-protein phosphatase [Oscillospiraceae bacterium]|nr:serine/threonine-protein phosphatase [Oscillospiraceae bacterium]